MNRKAGKHGKGVYQRCNATCPPDRCRVHNWVYIVELPPDHEGKRRQLTKGGFETAKDAAEARAEVVRQHRHGELPANGKLTVEQWLTKWLTLPEVTELRPSTIIGYSDHVRVYLVPHLGRTKLSELRSTQIVDMIVKIRRDREAGRKEVTATNAEYAKETEGVNATRRAVGKARMLRPERVAVPRPFGASSAQRLRATLRAALTAAMVHGEVARNVAAGKAVKIRGGERPKIQVWEPDQLRDFLFAVKGERLYPLVYLAAFAGLRRGELCGLSWDDVDLDRGRLVVRFQNTSVNYKIVRTKPKTRESEDATVDIDAASVVVLRAWKVMQRKEKLAWGSAWSNPDNLVFTREDGSGWHPDTVTKIFGRLVRDSDLPPTRMHDLRHLAGSLQISAGVDIAIVSKRLRHSTIKLTADTYGHLIGKAGKNAAEAAHELVFGQGDQATGRRRARSKRSA